MGRPGAQGAPGLRGGLSGLLPLERSALTVLHPCVDGSVGQVCVEEGGHHHHQHHHCHYHPFTNPAAITTLLLRHLPLPSSPPLERPLPPLSPLTTGHPHRHHHHSHHQRPKTIATHHYFTYFLKGRFACLSRDRQNCGLSQHHEEQRLFLPASG